MSKASDYLPAMVEAVRAAARICREVQDNLVDSDSVEKQDRSPVTVADLASQAVTCARLHELHGDIPIMAEEDSGTLTENPELAQGVLDRARAEWPGVDAGLLAEAIDRGASDGGASGRFFALDPIDGTKGFLRGAHYAVALALVEDGKAVAGVLGTPRFDMPSSGVAGSLHVAAVDWGARAVPLDGEGLDGEPLSVSKREDPTQMRLVESVESAHSDQSRTKTLRDELGVAVEPVRMDSQGKYAALARGDAEVYLRIPSGYTSWLWDHAAGVIVVEQAGGRVTDLDGKPIDFGCGRQLSANRGIAASNGPLHDAVLAHVK